MAITNQQIMADYKTAMGIPLEEPLYTFATWKAKGYKVKKGAVCHHRVNMWKHSNRIHKNENGEETENNYCFMKTNYLFTKDQVEEIVS